MSADDAKLRPNNPPTKTIPRDVDHCERYLDRLALVVERAGRNAAAFVPIVRRLERELAEAKADEEVLAKLRARLRAGSANTRQTNPQDITGDSE
ncbi:hypothetical protein NO932_11370 [Pelagibacterium sp. 26DY04]|uniref:Terminase small subunit n=2 Tax=Devosiaceae TaxID=2831106 RepID=A0ABZ2HYT9_9HYPH|nr:MULTISPECIES: hypothetical protein [Devosiaceae]QYO77303.1 hypothetical protein K1X15_01580 [Devosia salina]WMT85530.1 hypothetical protein NO932_11370 [Pelagibacterium sp. 26DY04]|tara:strand:+ start:5842 stop:6126 length:285 start_codon:yes stop_codon:yes gene_type:complete